MLICVPTHLSLTEAHDDAIEPEVSEQLHNLLCWL